MGGLFGGGGSGGSAPTALSSLRVSTSVLGRCVPWVFGTPRVAPNLIQYDDFSAIAHRQKQGGKGAGGGATTTTYTYTAAVIMALGGYVDRVGTIWIAKDKTNAAARRLDFYNGSYTQPVHPHWAAKHPATALAYHGISYLASAAYDLGDSGELAAHSVEVYTPTRISDSILDARPGDVFRAIITDPVDGLGLSADVLGDMSQFDNYCMANGIWISPCYDEQAPAHERLTRIAEIGHSAIMRSEGKITLVPYSDAAASGNGATYTPNRTPLFDLTADHFQESDQPVRVKRASLADANNHFQITYLNRASDYNDATVEAKDLAHIEKYGLRTAEPDDYHEICDGSVAQKLVNFKRDRALSVRNTYEFDLDGRFEWLEETDIVTLNYAPDGLNKTPVMITRREESEDGTIKFEAEDYPLGAQAPTRQPVQPNLATTIDFNVAAGSVNPPVVFEPSLTLTNGQPQIWAAVSGGANFGGAHVWASLDNTTYDHIGVIQTPARQGVLTAALPSLAGIDTANTLAVDMSMSRAELLSGSQDEANSGVTLCYVDGELLSYQTVNLSGVNTYNLSYLVRGLHGSAVNAHAAGKPFARIDDAVFKYPYNPEWIGKTIYLKFLAYNPFGAGAQSLADAQAVAYTIKGAPLPPVKNLALAKPWTGAEVWLKWDLLDQANRYEVQVYSGSTPVRTVTTVTEGQFVYTTDMLKQDGVTGRNLVFQVRPVSITGNTGAWSQVVATNAQIGALQGIKVTEGIGQVFLEYAQPVDADFAGIRVWISTSSLFDLSDELVAYDGRDSLITLARLPNGSAFDPAVTYYLRAAGYDSFGRDGLVASSSLQFKVISMSVADGSITATKIADDSVTTPKLVSGSVTTDKLIANAVTTEKIAASAVKTNNLDAKAVTADKMSVTELSAVASNLGNVNITKGQGSDPYGWIRTNGKWWADELNGTVIARNNSNGDTFFDSKAGSNRIWMSSWNDCGIEFPGIRMTNGGLTINQLDVIDTSNIANNAVSLYRSLSTNTSAKVGPLSEYVGFSFVLDVPSVLIFSSMYARTSNQSVSYEWRVDGIPIQGQMKMMSLAAGGHRVSCVSTYAVISTFYSAYIEFLTFKK